MLSIIITTFNRPEMLHQALQSVIKQDYKDREIIVVDDNSTMDNSFCIPMVDRYIKNDTNKGLGQNHIIGFKASKGDYICFMDDDDYYTDFTHYSNAISILESDKELTFVSASSTTKYEPFGELVPEILTHGHRLPAYEYIQHMQIDYKKPQSTFTTVFRRKVLEEAGLCTMTNPEDAALYLRTLTVGGYVCLLENSVGHYRVHPTNMSKFLNCDQMLNLLREQHEVYKRIKNKIRNPRRWWYKQYRFTYDFVHGSNHTKETIQCLTRWGLKHHEFSIMIPLFLLKYKLNGRI